MKLKKLEKSGTLAIKRLRENKLKNGFPFMINSKKLPSDQCYLEYPNGSIVLVILSRKDNDFKIIAKLSPTEQILIRKELSLTQINA